MGSRIIPESKWKESLRHVYYRFIYSLRIGTKNIVIENTNIKLIKTILSTDNKAEILEYLNYYKPKKNDVIIDAGGFYGIFSIYAAKNIGPEGKVLTFEIDPINLNILKKNISLNKVRNIKLIEEGLWNKKEYMGLSIGGAGSRVSDKNTIKNISLDKGDSIISKLNLKKIDFIKMNIEGAEINALKGMQKTLKIYSPKLLIMADHYFNNEVTEAKVIQILKELHYNVKVGRNHMVYAEK